MFGYLGMGPGAAAAAPVDAPEEKWDRERALARIMNDVVLPSLAGPEAAAQPAPEITLPRHEVPEATPTWARALAAFGDAFLDRAQFERTGQHAAPSLMPMLQRKADERRQLQLANQEIEQEEALLRHRAGAEADRQRSARQNVVLNSVLPSLLRPDTDTQPVREARLAAAMRADPAFADVTPEQMAEYVRSAAYGAEPFDPLKDYHAGYNRQSGSLKAREDYGQLERQTPDSVRRKWIEDRYSDLIAGKGMDLYAEPLSPEAAYERAAREYDVLMQQFSGAGAGATQGAGQGGATGDTLTPEQKMQYVGTYREYLDRGQDNAGRPIERDKLRRQFIRRFGFDPESYGEAPSPR